MAELFVTNIIQCFPYADILD